MRSFVVAISVGAALVGARPARPADTAPDPLFQKAAENGVRSEEVFRRTRRMMQAWLAYAEPEGSPRRRGGGAAARRA